MDVIESIIMCVIVFIAGYALGQYHAIDSVTDKIVADPEGFINLIRNAKSPNKEALELHKEKGMIYAFGKNRGFLAQAKDFDSLAQEIRRALPNVDYVINLPQKDFTAEELYDLAKLLKKHVDNTTTN